MKKVRLEEEREAIINLRKNALRQAYKYAAETHPNPDMNPYLPDASVLFHLPHFDKYIHDRKDIVVELPVEDTQKRILHYTNSIIVDTKRHLTKVLENAGFDSGDEKSFDLAAAIFKCRCPDNTLVYIGWEDIKLEDCMKCAKVRNKSGDATLYLRHSHFRHSASGYLALKNIAQLLDVDVRTVKAKDLDKMDKRFFCKNCSMKMDDWHNGYYGLEAMSWRECVRIPFTHGYH